MSGIKGKAVVAQSGGPTAVINASACGVIQTALEHPDTFTGVYGALNGVLGVLNEELFDLGREKPEDIEALKRTPAAELGSCRYKLKDLDSNRADYERILEVFKAHDIRFFFYIGGNDSMDTADKLARLAADENYEMQAVGVPKTVDNDLAHTDHCPGYGSVARYTAVSVMEAGRDTDALYTHDTVTVHEIMGRNAGWITAAAGLAKRSPADAPHLILVPEIPFVTERFVEQIKRCLKEHNRCFIACGEGIRTPNGKYLADVGDQFAEDSFGHVQLGGAAEAVRAIVENEVGVKCRTNRAGTAQRVAMHIASATDVKESYMCGAAAVSAAMDGVTGKMVTLQRQGGDEYRCTTGLADLAEVANGEKPLPREYLDAEGTGVTDEFRKYALPLIAGQAEIDLGDDGLPVYVRLGKYMVEKLTGRSYNAE